MFGGGVAEGGELAHGRIGAQPQRVRIQPGDRLQQRPVEQLGVQTPHPDGVAADLRAQHPHRVLAPVGTHMGGPGQPAHAVGVVVGGQGVGALEPL